MAQEPLSDTTLDSSTDQSTLAQSPSRNSSFSRLNAQAPEFVPRTDPRLVISPPGLVHVFPSPSSPFHVPMQNHHQHHRHPIQYHQYYGGGFGEQDIGQVQQAPHDAGHGVASRDGLSEEATQKILNQASFVFNFKFLMIFRCLTLVSYCWLARTGLIISIQYVFYLLDPFWGLIC